MYPLESQAYMYNEENTRIKEGGKYRLCLNCETPLADSASHCYRCGQSIKEARMTLYSLFSQLFTNIFNLDGKIWKTLRKMWWPAFLTKEYVSGRRTTYFNPARFFAITLILFFLLLTYTLSHSDLDLDSLQDASDITMSKLVTQYDSIATHVVPSADHTELDSLRKTLFGNARHVDQDTMFTNFNLFTDIGDYGILKQDAYSMSPEELNEKYEIKGWWNQLFVRQTIRINKNRESSLTYIIGNLSWGVILVLFFISALMKLLYVRGAFYYVEHAILMMLLHAKIFFVLNIVMIALIVFPDIKENSLASLINTIIGFALLYLFISMKIYYQQGWFKTFFKFFIVGISYIISLFFFMLLVSIIGAVLF